MNRLHLGMRGARPGLRTPGGRGEPLRAPILDLTARRIVDVESALRLQRSAGNAAVAALLSRGRPPTRAHPAARPVVQRDIGFEFQLRHNKIQTDKGRLFKRKEGKFFHEVGGLELQTEAGSFMEFETQHFRKWSDLEAQIKAAVDVVNTIRADPTAFPFNQEQRLRKEKVLRSGEKLEVDIQDSTFEAALQWTEGITLPQYRSLLREHEHSPGTLVTPVLIDADAIIRDARAASRSVKAGANVENLRGLLQIILSYLRRGQRITWDKTLPPEAVKGTFRLMMRTSFSSVFQKGLSPEEKKLFNEILASNAIPAAVGVSAADPLFKKGYWGDIGGGLHGFLERGKVTALANSNAIHDCSTTTATPGIDRRKCGRRVPGANITVGSWLKSIARHAKDALSPAPKGSGSMGNLSMQSRGPEKHLAVLEVRGSDSKDRRQPADNWVDFADGVFSVAATCRPRSGTGTELVYDGTKPADPWACP